MTKGASLAMTKGASRAMTKSCHCEERSNLIFRSIIHYKVKMVEKYMSGKKKSQETTKENFPIVGIGASAGGLSAFEAFFSSMSNLTPNIAFVLVQHLDPDHKSILAEIIQRYTSMHVYEVKDGMQIEPCCVYIIPPKYDIAVFHDTFKLITPSEARGHRLPIDFFFTSLAQAKKKDAVGIIFSGTGHDGTEGIRAIKTHGGLVIAQDLATAEFDGMPKSAIMSGYVDYTLAPNKILPYLMAHMTHQLQEPLLLLNTFKETNNLKKIFTLLYSQTGHDFSMYKPSTIKRRIERRMAVHQIETLEQYVAYLQSKKSELDELFKDLLIGVTNFFRDPELFASLEHNAIPKLFLQKSPSSSVRIWIAGCSSGEEAYSLAILLMEHMERVQEHYNVQIFATDIDARAIAKARTGLYPLSIAEHITKERLKRFFTLNEDASMYRIHKKIRDLLIFSEHNIIKDPPFSKLDMICCRNLLIYMSAALQRKIIPLFHYSLNPNGILFLGSSETIGEFGDYFEVLDQKAKIYQGKNNPMNSKITLSNQTQLLEQFSSIAPALFKKNQPKTHPFSHGAAEQNFLTEFVPAEAFVNSHGDILYLQQMPKEPLESAVLGANADPKGKRSIKELEKELHLKEKFLQTANNKVRTYNEELKSFNEEIQSMNEELQSTNEELETSKEELQSVNEELSTVNAELQEKVADLSRSNNDMNNLLAGTNIGTVFVDHKLSILRFTPAIVNIINLICVDVGRFIGHIVSNLINYHTLVEDIKSVLDTLIPKEMEVQIANGKWYLMRIQPYRTIENVIEGAVISFTDISEIVKIRQELRDANTLSHLAIIVRDSYDPIIVHDRDGIIIAWNPAAAKLYGWSEKEALGMHISQRIPAEFLEKELYMLKELQKTLNTEPYLSKRLTKNATCIDISITCSAMLNKEGKVYAISSIERALQRASENTHEK